MSLDGYEVKETLAQTPRTTVRRALRKQDGAKVVIKSLSREYPAAHELGQLEFEYRILCKLNAPGAIRALGLEKDGDRLAMILEDFGGENLPTATGGLAVEAFFPIALALAKTLGQIHAQNVIHKDLKPQNILCNPRSGEVKVIDFNIASELTHEHQDVSLANQLEGSLPYISPEQTGRMNRDLDYRSDYYSLGITFFEMLTGRLPYTATDTMGWVHCHISKPVPDLRDVKPSLPEPLALIVAKLMAKNPDDRYQSARGLLRDLELGRALCLGGAASALAPGAFRVGEHDVSERFAVSQQLFGREAEVDALKDAFQAASRGAAKLLLVGGYSGVGKSSLIREIQKSIVGRRGRFIAGKFDQLERNVPYGALAQALRALVKQLLVEPEESLRAWRQRLGAALGPQSAVLIDLIPELEQIVGRQPPAPNLSAREAHVRFQRAFRELLRAVALPDHPLVVFLDDLQWTDASTPELLAQLLGGEELRHLLVIGAYRDNEVHEGHLLVQPIKELEERRPDGVRRILLPPLPEASVNDLIADTLRCEPERCRTLSGLVYQKTAGNPFFVNELLLALHRDGAFHFVADEGRWDWDEAKIERAEVSDNVVDLMVQRLQRLPAETLGYLRLAACIGNRFGLPMMVRVAEQPAGAIAAALWEAVRQRVLLPVGSNYRLIQNHQVYDEAQLDKLDVQYQFQHDRVQQAADSLLDAEERTRIHHRIGRLLLNTTSPAQRDEKVFDLVNHLNLGRERVTELADRRELSSLNAVAGQKAKRSTAYAIAAKYLQASLALLSPAEWAAEPLRRFEVARAHVECVFLAGDVERASALGDELLAGAPDPLSGADAHYLKAGIVEHQGRLIEAVATIRKGLHLLSVELPEDHGEIDRGIGEGIGKMQAHLGRTRIEDFARLPEMTSPEKVMITNLLFQLIPPAIQTYPPLFVLAELLMFDLALTHGTTAASCKNFVDCGIIQGGILGDYPAAYRLGKVAFELLERYAPTPLESAVSFVFGAFVSHWRAPFAEGLEAFARAQRVGIEMGDVQHTAYARVHVALRLYWVGRKLEECQAETDDAVAHLTRVHAVNQLAGVSLVQRMLGKLRGTGADSEIGRLSDDEFTERIRRTTNAQWSFLHGVNEATASFLLGDPDGAERWLAFAAPFVPAGNALFPLPEMYLVDTLVTARRLRAARADDAGRRAELLARLQANQAKLAIWAENSPANFAHAHKLAGAEIARTAGAPIDEVSLLYDEAVTAAGDDFIHLRALANELQAELWADKRRPKIARTFLREAYELYRGWGAHAKLRQLEQKFPDWLSASSDPFSLARTTTIFRNTVGEATLDLDSVIKATQAITSEMRTDRLFAKLMATIIENAGAQRGCLILKENDGAGDRDDRDGDGLIVQARAHVPGDVRGDVVTNDREETRDALRPIPMEEHTELCPEIVRYVARTGDAIVLDDAGRHDVYGADPYVRDNAVKSVLCLPVMNQGRLVALLYAENNAVTHAFTPQRLSLLHVIASQAAISIANARLYDSLEEKVVERTRELGDRNREVAAMLNSMQQGVFTIDSQLLIQPQFSEHLGRLLGTRELAGKDCLAMLFRDSNIGPDALDAMRCALQFGFGVPLFLAELNAGHLVQEFQRSAPGGETRFFEVDWNLIVGDGGDVERVLVALRDVTLIRQLHATVAAKAREMDIVGQIVDAGLEGFHQFCSSARELAAEIEAVLRSRLPLSPGLLELFFRNMHTIKGNARLLGLSHLVDVAHLAEESYDDLRRDPSIVPDTKTLGDGVAAVLSAIDEHDGVCQRKLGSLTRGPNARFEQELAEIRALVERAARGEADAPRTLRSLEALLARGGAIPLGELVAQSARMLPSLARELRKATPQVEIDTGQMGDGDGVGGGGVALSPDWGAVMKDVLVHGFRNALDHGIEEPNERQTKGKTPHGHVRIQLRRHDAGATTLRLSDDGRGLPLATLRERADCGAGSWTDEELAERVFQSGISTAARVSAISGRGVGLDAIRSFIRRRQGDARIAFTAPAFEGHRPFELVIELPAGAVLLDASASRAAT